MFILLAYVSLFLDKKNKNCTQFKYFFSQNSDGIVTTEELFEAVRKLRNAPDETKTQRLIEVLDEDKDGELDLEELRNVSMSESQ